MQLNSQTYRLSDTGKVGTMALAVGVIGIVGCAAGFYVDRTHFFHAYLVAFVFWVTLGLGGLFFTMLHHLVGADWSVVVRRISECLMITLPLMAILFIPIALGMHELYHWSHAGVADHDVLLKAKAPWLNTGWFFIRAGIYFSIWSVLAWMLYNASIKQDLSYDESRAQTMQRISAPGMLVFALSITFASYDWLMSLDPHWYSTIFGVYVFAGSFLAVLSFLAVIALSLRTQGVLADTIRLGHYADLGKLIFGFTVFWAYIAFSQYFLIWYGNIPEETIWYQHRWDGSWKYVSLFLAAGHFLVPFVVLITREAKRNLFVLRAAAIWVLFMHWIDLYWLVLPNMPHAEGAAGVHFSWIDAAAMLAVGGVFFWFFWQRFTANAIVPVSDPRLEVSIRYTNA
ncbi:MAG: hypothetical protein IAF08_05065 [Rhizobacter sp.]|nr:hypothetical protein [Chlorobiales bacterium]